MPVNWPIGSGEAFVGVYELEASRVLRFERVARGERAVPVHVSGIDDPDLLRLLGQALGVLAQATSGLRSRIRSSVRAQMDALLLQTTEDTRPVELSSAIGRLTRIDAIQMRGMAAFLAHAGRGRGTSSRFAASKSTRPCPPSTPAPTGRAGTVTARSASAAWRREPFPELRQLLVAQV